MLLWRIASNLLPTRDLTSRFDPQAELACPFCGMEKETALHIFTKCHIARAVWYGSQWNIRIDCLHFDSTAQLIQSLLSPPISLNFVDDQKESFLLFGALALDCMWKWRNKIVHEKIVPSEEAICRNLFLLL
jgi:hypothetical protein